jgi:polysaccharide biosynthesis transport protein
MANEIEKTAAQTEPASHALNLMVYLHAIRRRKSLMLLGIIIGLMLGAFYYIRVPPIYESSSKVLITNKSPDVLASGDSRYVGMEDQVANQISMIRSPLIAEAAAKAIKDAPSMIEKADDVIKKAGLRREEAKAQLKEARLKAKEAGEELAEAESKAKEARKASSADAEGKTEKVMTAERNRLNDAEKEISMARARAKEADELIAEAQAKDKAAAKEIAEAETNKETFHDLPSFHDREVSSISGAILGSLNATRGDVRSGESTSVVILSSRTGNPKDSQAVLGAVLYAHKRVMEKSFRNLGEETADLISEMKDHLTVQLRRAQKDYNDFRVSKLYVPSGKDGEALHTGGDRASLSEKAAFQTRRETLLMRDAEIRAHLKALEVARKARQSPAALLAMAERFNAASGPMSSESPTSEALISLMGQEEELASTYGDDYIPLKRIRAHIALLRRLLPVKKAALTQNQAADPLERHINELKEEAQCNSTMCEAYASLIKDQQEQLREALQNELQNETLYGEYVRTKQLYDTTVKKLQEINLVKDMSGISTMVLAAPSGGRKVAPILSTCISLSIFIGLLVGLGLVYLAEITDRSFKGPEDVVMRLGAPVIAHMPAIDYNKLVTAADVDASTPLSPVLCVYHRPKSRDAEAIRGIRTAIFFANQANSTKIIQFTSAQAGDGKSTLACNVALSIAQSGKKVIIVEADLRRPSFGNVFGKMPDVGFSQVLDGSDRWQDALLTFPEVPNLGVLPCGRRPENPAELLTGPLLATTLDQMKQEYDYVIVDTPPLLPVTDPCSVAAHADGVILVVQMGRNTRPNAERACSLLETLGVRLLGVVMNRMTKDGGYGYGYGYGGYGYNYGGKYKYGGYAYRTDTGYYARNDAYYEEDHEHLNGIERPTNGKGS